MEAMSCDQLTQKKCLPCEGGVEPYTAGQAKAQLEKLEGWYLTNEGERIRKDWTAKNFMAGLGFFNKVAEVAEADGHHPDLHIAGYRNVSVELWVCYFLICEFDILYARGGAML